MAIDHFDGWDDYSTAQLNRNWTGETSNPEMCTGGAFDSNATVTTSGGRNSSGSFKVNGTTRSLNKTLASQASRAMGVAVKFTSFSVANLGLMAFGDAGTSQVTLDVNTDGTLTVRRGTSTGTVLGTSTLAVATGTWYYIEWKVTFSNTGSYSVNVNGVQWLTGTGDTTNTANSTANQIAVGCTGNMTWEFDDLYSDDAGIFHGDCRVETKLATGNGGTDNFVPLSGANWQNVDENPATDDTDYNSSGVAGDIDLYTYPALATGAGNVLAVMTVPVLRNDAAGNVTAASVYNSGGINFFGATNTVGSTTYTSYTDIQLTDPNDGAWTITSVNAMLAAGVGIKRVA